MPKIVEIISPVQEWMDENGDKIHQEILRSCEIGLSQGKTFVYVMGLKTTEGIVQLTIDGPKSIVHSLKLSLKSFIENEEYELAARTRDCLSSWEEKMKNQ